MWRLPDAATGTVVLLVCLTLPHLNAQSEHSNVDDIGAPAMIDCELSAWAPWASCHPCLGVKYRSRGIVRFGQYNGRVCVDALAEERICGEGPPGSPGVCGDQRPECSNFQCENGLCVSARLQCNEDDDCGDYSDEGQCDSVRPACRIPRDISEMGRTAGTGVNVLGLEPRASPFDNDWFNGQCKIARDGNTKTFFRIPWNVMSLNYQTQADEILSSETHTVASELVQTTIRESTFNLNVGLSLKGIVDASLKRDTTKSVNKILELSQSETNEYFSVEGKIKLGEFRMRSRDYRLTEEFVRALGELMVEYEKGQYFRLLDDYGTHYTSRGVLGGVYRLLYVLNQNVMKTKAITTTMVKMCLGLTSKVTLPTGTEIIDFDPQWCKPNTNTNNNSSLTSRVIKDVVSFVRGGSVAFLSKLQRLLISQKESVDGSLYAEWASSLIDSPVLIKQTSYPISSLVPVTMANASTIRRNLDRAIQDYVAEYSTCKCSPCQNGGTPIQLNGECKCVCSQYHRGLGCQIKREHYKGSGIDYTDGQWSCWGSWSSCSRAQQTRTRVCVGISGAGQPCPGDNTSTEYC